MLTTLAVLIAITAAVQAQESGPPTPETSGTETLLQPAARAPADQPPRTLVFIVGVSEIYQKPDVPGVPTAVDDCRALETFFEETAGLGPDNVRALCGSSATRSRHYSVMNDFIGARDDIAPNDVVVYIAVGPGWMAPATEHSPEAPQFLLYDAFTSDGSMRPGMNDADTIAGVVQKYFGPMDIPLIVLTDTVHFGTYEGQSMIGPDAKDFESYAADGVRALSATGGGQPSPPSAFAGAIMACWTSSADHNRDGLLQAQEFSLCVAEEMSRTHQTAIGMSGNWDDLPIGTLDTAPVREHKPFDLTKGLRYAALGVGLAALGGGAYIHTQATPLYGRLSTNPEATYANLAEWQADQERYNQLYWMRAGLYTLGAVSLAVSGGTFVIGPDRVVFTGTF